MTDRPVVQKGQGLTAAHTELVAECLRSHISKQHRVYLFGSRARGDAQPFSDLDLCLEGPNLNYAEMSALQDEFSESDLPYGVDVVQKSKLSKDFLSLIAPDFIELAL